MIYTSLPINSKNCTAAVSWFKKKKKHAAQFTHTYQSSVQLFCN
uniref:Uncharacterized protein n=1 Tax=Arundo donax TaxID=35708 RepID=A0A0A9D0F4_ARUDO